MELCESEYFFYKARKNILKFGKDKELRDLLFEHKCLLDFVPEVDDTLLLIAVERRNTNAVKILLTAGVNPLQAHKKRLPIIEALVHEDDTMFDMLTKYGYLGCTDVKICSPVLMKLLIMKKFNKFEHFAQAISINMADFFRTKFAFHYPFFLFCGGGNYETFNYLIENYSMDELNILGKEGDELSSVIMNDDENQNPPYENILYNNYKQPLTIGNFLPNTTLPEQKIMKCLNAHFFGFDNNNIEESYLLQCALCTAFSQRVIHVHHYEMFQKLLNMGYLTIEALSYNYLNINYFPFFLAFAHEELEDILMLEKIIQEENPFIYLRTFKYVLKRGDRSQFLWFLETHQDIPLHLPHSQYTASQTKSITYVSNKTPLSKMLQMESHYKIVSYIYMEGNILTNILYPRGWGSCNYFKILPYDEADIAHLYKEHYEDETPVYQYPLYTVIEQYFSFDCTDRKEITSLIKHMYAAGEHLPPTQILEGQDIYQSPTSKKLLKNKETILKICPFRGPGDEDWLIPICIDVESDSEYVPNLYQLTRKAIRDHFLKLNRNINLFNMIKKLPIPSLIQGTLLFNCRPEKDL